MLLSGVRINDDDDDDDDNFVPDSFGFGMILPLLKDKNSDTSKPDGYRALLLLNCLRIFCFSCKNLNLILIRYSLALKSFFCTERDCSLLYTEGIQGLLWFSRCQ